MNFRVYQKVSGLTAFMLLGTSCATMTANYRQEIPSAININKEKDTAVVMRFPNDKFNITESFNSRLQQKGFKTMSMENYYDYRDTLKKKTNFVTIKGQIEALLSGPDVTRGLGEQCGIDSRNKPIYSTVYTSTANANIKTLLDFNGLKEGAYSTTINGSGIDQITWSQCGGHSADKEANLGNAINQAVSGLDNEFDNIIADHWENIPVILFKGKDAYNPALNSGNALFAAGNLEAAAKEYKNAIAQAQANPKASKKDVGNSYYNLGMAQGFMGNSDAFNTLEKAYSINPNAQYLQGRNQMNQFFETNVKLKNKSKKK